MNREIKFRVWDTVLKGYTTSRHIGDYFTYEDESLSEWSELNDIFRATRWIFQQYTGLKDKNGEEIYEGDILECKWRDFHFYYRVYWLDTTTSFEMVSVKEYDIEGFDEPILSWMNLPRLEVAGNEFENPELLKQYGQTK